MTQISNVNKMGISGDFYLPETSRVIAVAVLIHGGGWTSMGREAMEGVARGLSDGGVAVLNIDYRLAPQHLYPSGIDDCRNAIRWLYEKGARRYGVEGKPLFVLGASAGGHYALMASLAVPSGIVAGIISISGITDTIIDQASFPDRYELLLGHRPERRELEQLNPISFYGPDAPPILCTHCCHDTVVPCECTRKFAAGVVERGGRIRSVIYDFGRRDEGHAIWQPGTSPKKLYPDLEEEIFSFIQTIISGSLLA